jgi:hypothetical protein
MLIIKFSTDKILKSFFENGAVVILKFKIKITL